MKLSRKHYFQLILSLCTGLIFCWSEMQFISMVSKVGTDGDMGAQVLKGGLLISAIIAAGFITKLSLDIFAEDVSYQIHKKLADSLILCTYRDLERIGIAKGYSALTRDLEVIYQGMRILPELVLNALLLAGVFIYLAIQSPRGFLTYGLVVACAVGVSYIINSQVVKHLDLIRTKIDELHGHYQAFFKGAIELRLSRARQQYQRKSTASALTELLARRKRIAWLDAFNLNWGHGITISLILAIIAFPEWFFSVKNKTLQLNFVLATLFLISPITVLLENIGKVLNATISIRRILPLTTPTRPPQIRHTPSETLSLQGLRYRYPNEERSIGDMDLTVRRGEITFIVGGNGSGKSTLFKLLTGLYPAHHGVREVDGKPLENAHLVECAMVEASPYVFDRLLALDGNIPSAETVARLIERLWLTGKVGYIDGRLSCTTLSQGQTKRLALLTALASGQNCLLLDEFAADQDPQFKRYFYRTLLRELKAEGKTLIVISHDAEYFDAADRVLKMTDGCLSEISPEVIKHDLQPV
ncbi:ATP-binding cassette domain-containing protein [Paludibacterium paludis]|uniref:Peptide ABC transporter ATP-binding protein n=1 Tax=Paludibacterium paludis TaxID=1225769 RepID=A0A918U9B2_9NEIS|nr:ATP-binding cassette domain-containing protein [Paludibacterium paludis]GGY11349.1 peptide ABC transporter ATP-binding protein [Paludibacterium paludis]